MTDVTGEPVDDGSMSSDVMTGGPVPDDSEADDLAAMIMDIAEEIMDPPADPDDGMGMPGEVADAVTSCGAPPAAAAGSMMSELTGAGTPGDLATYTCLEDGTFFTGMGGLVRSLASLCTEAGVWMPPSVPACVPPSSATGE